MELRREENGRNIKLNMKKYKLSKHKTQCEIVKWQSVTFRHTHEYCIFLLVFFQKVSSTFNY